MITPTTQTGLVVATLSRWKTNDATTSQTVLFKNYASSTLAAASYKIATSSGAITDSYTVAAGGNQDWVMAAVAFRPATSTSAGTSTTTATTTLTYDNNGNLTAEATTTYSWDYRNRLTQSGNGTAASSYSYDDDVNRVKLTEGSITTFLPNSLYSAVTNATTTKHIFANGILLATIESTGTTTSVSGGGGGSTSTSTPAYVQSKKDVATGVATFTNPVTTGNTVVVGLTIWDTAIPSNAITDNKGNTYTKIGESINVTTTDHAAIFYAKNVNGGPSFTVTSSVRGSIAIHEYSGLSTTTPLDNLAPPTSSSTLPRSAKGTTALDNEL